MNIKISGVLLLLFICLSCKHKQEEHLAENVEQNESQVITEKDISRLKYTDFILDTRTEKAIVDWKEYYTLFDVLTNVKKGDLSYFNAEENPHKDLFKNMAENIPAEVDSDAIKARILALETKFYKLETFANISTSTKKELLGTIKEFLVAFSNLNLQMNKKIEGDNIIIEKP